MDAIKVPGRHVRVYNKKAAAAYPHIFCGDHRSFPASSSHG